MTEEATVKKITPAQQKAIEALLTSGSTTEAAALAGVNRGTIYRWKADPVFMAALREAESEAVQGLSRALAGLGDMAAQALRDALAPTNKINVRLRAAEVVCNNLLKLRELVELEARLAALEASR